MSSLATSKSAQQVAIHENNIDHIKFELVAFVVHCLKYLIFLLHSLVKKEINQTKTATTTNKQTV